MKTFRRLTRTIHTHFTNPQSRLASWFASQYCHGPRANTLAVYLSSRIQPKHLNKILEDWAPSGGCRPTTFIVDETLGLSPYATGPAHMFANSRRAVRTLASAENLLSIGPLPRFYSRHPGQSCALYIPAEHWSSIPPRVLQHSLLHSSVVIARSRDEVMRLLSRAGLRHHLQASPQESSKPPSCGLAWKISRRSKPTLTFYASSLLNNGITTSLMLLLSDEAIHARYQLVVLDKESLASEALYNLKRFPDEVAFVLRDSVPLFTLAERVLDGLDRALPVWPKAGRKRAYQREFRRITGHLSPDIVIDYGGYSPFWTILFGSSGTARRVVFQHNDMSAEARKPKHRGSLPRVFRHYRDFDVIANVGFFTRERNARAFRFYARSERFVVIHNQSSAPRLSPDQQALLDDRRHWLLRDAKGDVVLVPVPHPKLTCFVSVGRLSEEKDHAKLLVAFREVHFARPSTTLLIVGDGPLRKNLERQVDELGLRRSVILTGYIADATPLLHRANCFVLPSIREGQPMVLLEAMAHGLPIIATDNVGARSAIHCGYGFVAHNSVEGLKTAMEKFLDGAITARSFDLAQYNATARTMFLRHACADESITKRHP